MSDKMIQRYTAVSHAMQRLYPKFVSDCTYLHHCKPEGIRAKLSARLAFPPVSNNSAAASLTLRTRPGRSSPSRAVSHSGRTPARLFIQLLFDKISIANRTFERGREMSESDVTYCKRRAREERKLAAIAAHPRTAAVHAEMAERYENLLTNLRSDRSA